MHLSEHTHCYHGGENREGLLLPKDILGNTTAMKTQLQDLDQEILGSREGPREALG